MCLPAEPVLDQLRLPTRMGARGRPWNRFRSALAAKGSHRDPTVERARCRNVVMRRPPVSRGFGELRLLGMLRLFQVLLEYADRIVTPQLVRPGTSRRGVESFPRRRAAWSAQPGRTELHSVQRSPRPLSLR